MDIRSRGLAAAIALPVVLIGALAACATNPGSTTPSSSASASDAPRPTETTEPAPETTEPAPDATGKPGAFALPETCEDVWTPEMFAELSSTALNDPGVTMLSTEVVEALELLDVVPSLRCTWGQPSEWGIATTVAAVDEAQGAALADALRAEGFACADGEVQRCERSQTLPGEVEGEPETTLGETHLIGDGGWVASHWLNAEVEPEYSDSIAAQLWG